MEAIVELKLRYRKKYQEFSTDSLVEIANQKSDAFNAYELDVVDELLDERIDKNTKSAEKEFPPRKSSGSFYQDDEKKVSSVNTDSFFTLSTNFSRSIIVFIYYIGVAYIIWKSVYFFNSDYKFMQETGAIILIGGNIVWYAVCKLLVVISIIRSKIERMEKLLKK